MEAKHTPAPWHVVRLEGRTSYKLVNEVTSEAQAQANRVLMEATPELLEACEHLMEFKDGQIVHRASLNKIRDAIAKAKQ